MLFMVMSEFDLSHIPTDPKQMAAFAELVLIPSLEMIQKWEEEGLILAGGIRAGGHECVYIVDVASNEQLSDYLQSMPGWTFSHIETAPLENTEHRINKMKGRLERLKALVG